LIPTAFFLHVGGTEKALMVASVLLVLVVELLNSAVEAAVDRISLENHALAKRAKDIGSAAVFLSLIKVAAGWARCLLKEPAQKLKKSLIRVSCCARTVRAHECTCRQAGRRSRPAHRRCYRDLSARGQRGRSDCRIDGRSPV